MWLPGEAASWVWSGNDKGDTHGGKPSFLPHSLVWSRNTELLSEDQDHLYGRTGEKGVCLRYFSRSIDCRAITKDIEAVILHGEH